MSAPGDASAFDPDDAATRDFTRVRKGFDPAEVRRYLGDLAQEIRRLQQSEARLAADLAVREQEPEPEPEPLDDLIDEPSLDPNEITRTLGEETVRILDAAREAAEEIRSKAEENAGRLVRDAHERANRMTRDAAEARESAAADAEETLSSARREAEAAVSDARAEADALLADAEARAASLREDAELVLDQRTAEAEAEAARIREEAEGIRADAAEEAAQRLADAAAEVADITERANAEAERILEGARDEGREMIREAKEARERMIRDLAERRHASRQQLEALRAGRERLIEAFGAAREALDDATDELVDSLPSAREAADAAARAVEEDLDAATVELDALVARGADTDELIEGDPTLAVVPEGSGHDDEVDHDRDDDGDHDDDHDDDDLEVADVVALGPGHDAAEPVDTELDDDDEDDDDDLDDDFDEDEDEDDDDEDDEDDDEDDEDRMSAEPVGGHLRLVSSNDDGPRPAGLDALVEAVETVGDAAAEEAPANTGEVEKLFARLRADHVDTDTDTDTETDDADDAHLGDDADAGGAHGIEDDDAAAGAVVIDLSVGDHTSDDRADDAADDTSDDAVVDPADAALLAHQALLDERDELLADAAGGLARRVRRVVTDQENEVLDLVRRNRRLKASDDLLPSRDDQLESFRTAVHKDFRTALTAGADFVALELATDATDTEPTLSADAAERAVDELLEAVGEWIVDPLRNRLARVVDDSDDTSPDRSELVERIRATYREWRNDRLAELSGDLATLAFSKGVMGATPDGEKLCWIVDHGGLPCADGEDNQLAGPVAVGAEYPTGDVCPPAHPGCRCLLVPAAR